MPSHSNSKIGTVGALRGLAAAAVCWFHFTFGQHPWLQWTGHYGWLGVHVFFVISGFLIPYSLSQYRYSLRDYFRFLGKRLARLHPPYLASMVVVLALGYGVMLIPHWHARPMRVSLTQVAAHFLYLNDLIGKPWLNVVYWTLAIELQWYLLLGLVFPLLASRRWYLQIAGSLLVLAGHALVPNQRLIFHIVPVFLIGVFVFQYRRGTSSLGRSLLSMAAMFAIMKTPIGMPVSVVSVATALCILFVTIENRWLLKLGEISYSLYLLHIPIGLLLLDLLSRLPYSGNYLVVIDLITLAACIYASVLFYRWIEAPSQKWSSAIKIKPHPQLKVNELEPVAAGAD